MLFPLVKMARKMAYSFTITCNTNVDQYLKKKSTFLVFKGRSKMLFLKKKEQLILIYRLIILMRTVLTRKEAKKARQQNLHLQNFKRFTEAILL